MEKEPACNLSNNLLPINPVAPVTDTVICDKHQNVKKKNKKQKKSARHQPFYMTV